MLRWAWGKDNGRVRVRLFGLTLSVWDPTPCLDNAGPARTGGRGRLGVVDGARPASELMGAILGAGQATPEAPIRVSLVLPDTAPTVQPRASARASLGGTLLDAVSHAVSSGKGRVRTLTA